MDIAVRLESINLGNERVIFKPIGIIKGVYDDKDGVFIDEYGYEFDQINEYDVYNNNYFWVPTSLKDLKEIYPNEYSEDEILEEFLLKFLNIYYVGYIDNETEKINIFEIDFHELEQNLYDSQETNINSQQDYLNLIREQLGLQGNKLFMFDMNGLNYLKNCENIDDVKVFIDELINTGKQISECINNDKSSKTEKQKKLSLKKEESKKFNLTKLRKEVLSNIIGQDEAVYDITRAIAINQTSNNPRNKSHILVTGPSGTGKTEIVNVIAKELDLPIFKADATAYTKEGYVGKSVYSMLSGLLEAANGDLEKAQNGILIIDEIDKKSSNSKDDVSGKSVLHSMLKILDRDVIELDLDYGFDKVTFDTSNLTVILMGSFDELYEEKKKDKKNSIGFNSEFIEDTSKVRIDEEDLIKWLGPEFVGRVGSITCTNELKLQDVLKILKKSKISPLNTAKQDLADRGIKLICTAGFFEVIAKKGLSKKLGIRKLNKIVKNSLVYAYDEILDNDNHNYKTLKLTKATALDPRKYFLG